MLSKNPTKWPLEMWWFAIAIALVGGMVGHLDSNKNKPKSIKESCLESACAGYVGFLGFMAANSFGLDPGLCGVLSGVVAHKGTRALFLVWRVFNKKIEAIGGNTE
jgi:hypothetical protein